MFQELRDFLRVLEAAGELVRISEELSPLYEIGAAIRYADERGGPAVLCERVKGYDVPVVGNLLGTRRRLAIALGVAEARLKDAYWQGRQDPIRPRLVKDAPVQDVVIDRDVDILAAMPILTHHERDASPYMSSAFTVAKDPETGLRSMGLHRVQVKDQDTIGIFLATPPLSHFLTKAETRGQPLEIAIVSGAAPAAFFASCVSAPQGIDKFDLAGGFMGRPIELVKCRTVDLEVPAYAEFVLEGEIIPGRRETEGPFGESTGYYLTYDNPVGKIKAITHRKSPIYHALMPFTIHGEESVLTDLPVEVDLLLTLQAVVPGVQQVRSPSPLLLVVQIEKRSEDDAPKVIDALLPRPSSKLVIVVDTDVDVDDLSEVLWAVTTRAYLDRGLLLRSGLPGLIIDPSTTGGEITPDISYFITRTTKMGIDATKPLAERERLARIDLPPAVKQRVYELMARALRR